MKTNFQKVMQSYESCWRNLSKL